MPATSRRLRNDWPVGSARGAALAVTGLSLLACLAAFINGLPIFLQLFLALIVLAGGALAVRRLLWPEVAGLKVDGRRVRVRQASGDHALTGELAGVPFVSPVYVGFRWRPDGARLPRSIGVFRAQLNAVDFRRLCAELRQGGET